MKKKAYRGNQKTQARIQQAISDLASLVGATLGPGGRPILLEVDNRPPLSTKDGVTVARHYEAEGDIERVVTEAAREICERTVREVGDGTTTAIVLGSAIVEAGQKWLEEHPDVSPQSLARQLKTIYQESVKPSVLSLARPIRDLPAEEAKEAARYIALVSANHDEEIAKAVAEGLDLVGERGMIVVEEGAGRDTRVVHQEGFSFPGGLQNLGGGASLAFVNRQDYGDTVLDAPYVCLYDGEINDPNSLAPLLERVALEVDESGHRVRAPIIIFAHRFSEHVLRMLAQNFKRGALSCVPVLTASNGQAQGRSHFLSDVSAYVGGIVLDSQGNTLPSAQLPQLGMAEKIRIGKSESVIFGSPEQASVEKRIEELERQMEDASEFDRELTRYRIGRLTGGVATIFAGGASQLEAKERHARVVDAVSAVRSAMELGVVPGGGVTLVAASEKLRGIDGPAEILAVALLVPFHQILWNAGVRETRPSEIGLQKDGKFIVYDALRHEYVEWWKGGIMDPAKVALSAVENALSVAQLLMTCGGVVAMVKTEESDKIRQMQEGMLKAIEGEALS